MKLKWSKATFVTSIAKIYEIKKFDLPELLIWGKSNVGKSTLINTLLNQKKLVKTSQKPGKTRLLNYFLVDDKLHIVDAPGYGYANVSKTIKANFVSLVEKYLVNTHNNKMVLFLLDSRHKPTSNDKTFLNMLLKANCNVLVLATKYDKLNQKEKHQLIVNLKKELKLEKDTFLPVSSSSLFNIDKLKKIILEIIF